MADAKKVANNILDFLIDPTRIPVRERVYFRPEETLKNECYENAKADAKVAYKDQRHNSDFYPQQNRSMMNKEAQMDRRSLIASFDILSKNFDEKDPFSVELRTMALAMSKMSDDEATKRIVPSENDGVVVAKKMKTFKCPDCGTKVLEQTGYCVKCKAKVKKASDAEIIEEDAVVEAAEEHCTCESVSTFEDNWTKEASDLVAEALVADIIAEKKEKEVVVTPETDMATNVIPISEDASKADKAEAPKAEAPKAEAPKAEPKVTEEDAVKEKESSVVDTDILASSISFGDIDIPMNVMANEIGDLSVEEQKKLADLF